jgi:hypothetical protein
MWLLYFQILSQNTSSASACESVLGSRRIKNLLNLDFIYLSLQHFNSYIVWYKLPWSINVCASLPKSVPFLILYLKYLLLKMLLIYFPFKKCWVFPAPGQNKSMILCVVVVVILLFVYFGEFRPRPSYLDQTYDGLFGIRSLINWKSFLYASGLKKSVATLIARFVC